MSTSEMTLDQRIAAGEFSLITKGHGFNKLYADNGMHGGTGVRWQSERATAGAWPTEMAQKMAAQHYLAEGGNIRAEEYTSADHAAQVALVNS